MKFEKLDYASSGSTSVDSLSHNLKQFGYDIKFGVRLIPYLVDGKNDEIELVWEMELGSGRTIHTYDCKEYGVPLIPCGQKISHLSILFPFSKSAITTTNPEMNSAGRSLRLK